MLKYWLLVLSCSCSVPEICWRAPVSRPRKGLLSSLSQSTLTSFLRAGPGTLLIMFSLRSSRERVRPVKVSSSTFMIWLLDRSTTSSCSSPENVPPSQRFERLHSQYKYIAESQFQPETSRVPTIKHSLLVRTSLHSNIFSVKLIILSSTMLKIIVN